MFLTLRATRPGRPGLTLRYARQIASRQQCSMRGGCGGADTVTIFRDSIPGTDDHEDEIVWCSVDGFVSSQIVDVHTQEK